MAKNSGHTEGNLQGNMMAHNGSEVPFRGTGVQPGPSISPIDKLVNSNAHDPGAARMDAMVQKKLADSVPYPVPGVNSWTGGSGLQGGSGAKTRKG